MKGCNQVPGPRWRHLAYITAVAVLATAACASDDPAPAPAAQELVEALPMSSASGGAVGVSEQEHKLEESTYSAVGTIAAETREEAVDTISGVLTELAWSVDSAGETDLSLGYRVQASRGELRAQVFTGPGGQDLPGFPAQPGRMWVAFRVGTANSARGWQ